MEPADRLDDRSAIGGIVDLGRKLKIWVAVETSDRKVKRMKLHHATLLVAIFMLSQFACVHGNAPDSAAFSYDQTRLAEAKPWTAQEFRGDRDEFHFAIIGDRTGGANAQGTFKLAVDQLNLLLPEFVINVGDSIEGCSDDKAKLNAEWDEFDGMLEQLEMPFFRTPGNHDIANDTAQEVWRKRNGATHYYFV
jgi:hypothetical protein